MAVWTGFEPRDGLIVDHYGRHPAVVLAVSETVLTVIFGSSRHRPHLDEVSIEPASPAAKMLGLSTRTYFNSSRIAQLTDPSVVIRKSGR